MMVLFENHIVIAVSYLTFIAHLFICLKGVKSFYNVFRDRLKLASATRAKT
jgi:hypothetical protein